MYSASQRMLFASNSSSCSRLFKVLSPSHMSRGPGIGVFDVEASRLGFLCDCRPRQDALVAMKQSRLAPREWHWQSSQSTGAMSHGRWANVGRRSERGAVLEIS